MSYYNVLNVHLRILVNHHQPGAYGSHKSLGCERGCKTAWELDYVRFAPSTDKSLDGLLTTNPLMFELDWVG